MPRLLHRVAITAAIAMMSATAMQAQRYAAPALLISPQELNRELHDPSLVLLQVGPPDDYQTGHIEGARLINLRDIAVFDSATNTVLDLPPEADLRSRLERLGVGDGSNVVVIAGADWTSPSTRVVWTLQAAGLVARTRLLDGGTVAWKKAGLPLTTTAPYAPTPGRLTVPADRSIWVDYTWVESHETAPGVRLIDARAPVFFEGVGMPEHNAPAGHIAGAANVPFNSLVDDDGRLLPPDELRRLFASAGVQPGDTVTAYCHVGQQATVVLFAARLLGHPIRLYDGSMADWQNRKLPVVNPTAPKPSGARPSQDGGR